MTTSTRRLLAWLTALFPILWSTGFTRSMGSDLWWHIASGDWMRAHGEVVTKDPFSYTYYEEPWIHHEWLGDIFLSFWSQYLGKETLIYWKWGMILATFYLLFRVAIKLCDGRMFWPAVTVIAAAATATPFLDIRPQLYTFVGYTIVLNLFWAEGKARWAIPPLVALWVNLHGGFIFALMTLGVLLIPEFVDEPEKRRPAVLLFVLTTLATGLNPHGFKTTIFPFHYALQGDNIYKTVVEWLPPLPQGGGLDSLAFPYLMVVFCVVALVWFVGKWRPTDLRLFAALILAVLTLSMALQSRRFVPLFGFSSVLILAPALSLATERWKDKVPFFVAPLLVFILGCFCVAPFPKDTSAFGYMVAEDQYPIDICDFMEANNLEGKVFCYYNYSGYLHLRGKGKWKVYIDGRADTVYPEEHYRDYLEVLNMNVTAPSVIEESKPDFFLWPFRYRKLAEALLSNGRWQILHVDSQAILLAKSSVDYPELKMPPTSPWRLLAEGNRALMGNRLEDATELIRQSLKLKPTFRGYELLMACLKATQSSEAEMKKLRQEWQNRFPHDTWFIKAFGA